jgi:ubiquitin C-terminal hydrolase
MMKNMYCKEYSEFLKIFYGIHVSKLETITGEYLTSTPEPFLLLDLPLPDKTQESNESCTLGDCLEMYTKEELLDGENKYKIEKTGEWVDAKKQILFWSLPDILIITIKRFSNSLKKNEALVDFPLVNLDLSKYVIGYDSEDYVYNLYGVCNHMGGISGGHYTACVKNANEKWYHYNDQDITPIEKEDTVVSPFGYCLFYCKKNN